MSDPAMLVNREWASRPADERWGGKAPLVALHTFLYGLAQSSRAGKVSTKDLIVKPKGTDIVLSNGKSDMIFNNWSARQLSALSGIPSAMYQQPADLLASNFNWGLRARETEEIQILATKAGPSWQARALTGPTYGRIWNHEVVKTLIDHVGDGFTGTWKVPGIRGTKLTEVNKDNTTVFGGDQDIFIMLADEDNRVEVKGRRDGKPGTLARGVMIGNSEVGSGTAWIAMAWYDYLCANRIIWGLDRFERISIRHTSGGPGRWLSEAMPQIKGFMEASAKPAEAKIKEAQQHMLGSGDQIADFLNRRFTKSQTVNMLAVHVEEEGRPVATRWDAVTAATAYAKSIPWQNERVTIERKAGEMLAA